MKLALGQETSFDDKSANKFRLDAVKGNWRCTLTPFTVTRITVADGRGTASREGGGDGTATLICDAETYSIAAGWSSKVTATPAMDGSVPSGATTPVAGPRFEPKIESNWKAATA